MKMKFTIVWLFALNTYLIAQELPTRGLILDLDAGKGTVLRDGNRVISWENQVADSPIKEFTVQEMGRKEAGSGWPTLRQAIAKIGSHSSLVFHQQELVCPEEDAFDSLTTGRGHTWMAVIAVHPQRLGLKDVNSFFGNLRNGAKYEGLWGCLNDDNSLWWGARNGLSFGRFDDNNPQVLGPKLETHKFYLIAGRMAAGLGTVKLELFVNEANPAATAEFPVNVNANPSRMAIGQERDAIEHPGFESFDGEIARFLIWDHPLDDEELKKSFGEIQKAYRLVESSELLPL